MKYSEIKWPVTKFLAEIVSFDQIKSRIVLELSFVDEGVVLLIEELMAKKKVYSFAVGGSHFKKNLSHQQRKMWFSYIAVVLNSKAEVSAENIIAVHEQWKRTYLPCGYITIGTISIPVPRSLADDAVNGVSVEEMTVALQKIRQDYEQLGVEFNEQ